MFAWKFFQTQQQGHEQAEEPLFAYVVVRLRPSSDPVQMSMLRETTFEPLLTTELSAHCNPQLQTGSALRPVLRLNTNSSCYLGKRIANDDFKQDRFHETFCSAPPTARLPGGIFQKVRNSIQRHHSGLPDDFWS
ncbi:hypothetical protein TNCV_2875411 [Trichonephila clavipes]|nr:hypothetical protein TNCV_2875411 [Trichonephila clavipes]